MNETEILEYFKNNELKYPTFRAIANALKWDFTHDLFDSLHVQCIIYQPRLKKSFVAELGTKQANRLLKPLACFVPKLNTVIVNLPQLAKHHYFHTKQPISFYEFVKTIVEHEYLHAYFEHTKVLVAKNKLPLIKAVRQESEIYYKDSAIYQNSVANYKNGYKKYANYHEILEEEFLIQFYTTQFERNVITVGSPFMDRLMAIMQDVHPYFTIAKAPKQVGKKLERISF